MFVYKDFYSSKAHYLLCGQLIPFFSSFQEWRLHFREFDFLSIKIGRWLQINAIVRILMSNSIGCGRCHLNISIQILYSTQMLFFVFFVIISTTNGRSNKIFIVYVSRLIYRSTNIYVTLFSLCYKIESFQRN